MPVNIVYENERTGISPVYRKTGDGYAFIKKNYSGRDIKEI
jgi:hypothetical protein